MKKINIDKINDKKILKILFSISFIFSIIIGILVTYNFDFTDNYNLIFHSDTARVIGDMTNFSFSHYRIAVHPLFLIMTNSIYLIIESLVVNKMLSLIIISSLVTSIAVLYMYKTLSLFNNNKKINILLSLCYLFSFSNLIYTSGIEIYNMAALFLIIMWYYVFKKAKTNDFNTSSYIILVILGITSIGFTVTNFIVYIIALSTLFVFKKIKVLDLTLVVFSTLFISLLLMFVQNMVWHNTPLLTIKNMNKEKEFTNFKITKEKISNVLSDDYYRAILGDDIYVEVDTKMASSYNGRNYTMKFQKHNPFSTILICSFYCLLLLLIIRNLNKNQFVNISLILTLIFNTVLHILYGNDSAFLYSLHFLYIFFMLFGINLSTEKSPKINKICYLFLIIFLIGELIINSIFFTKVVNIIKSILNCNYYVAHFGVITCLILSIILISVIVLILHFIIKLIKKHKKLKNSEDKIRNAIIIGCLFLLIHLIFIGLETSEKQNKILFFKLDPIYSKVKYIDANKYVISTKPTLDKHFKKEIASLETYKKEYKELQKDYKSKKVKFLKSNYYFFGLGNRKKYLYKDYQIIDLDTKEIIYALNGKNDLIIPNLYTVLLETWEGNYIKIYEDNNGLHYNVDGEDTILEGTDKYIELYDFKEYKYQNTLKVLYSEILFNIKDSAIYPNIFVYKNPWYRDAAIASMVLEKTGNIDLISDWVKNITSIYDGQNRGDKEPDNLGELLYLLSTQDSVNKDLVKQIEEEASNLAKKNKKGNYIIGNTDGNQKPLYQNLWYKLGAERLNLKFDFDLDNLDDEYYKLSWWSNYTSKKKVNNYLSVDFPYLTIAGYHKTKTGKIPLNENIYPLSWERNASCADYGKVLFLDEYYAENRISPTHVWSASELLLLLLENN